MARITLALISVVLMLVLVERTVSFTAVDASWGKRSEKVRIEILAYAAYMCGSILPFLYIPMHDGSKSQLQKNCYLAIEWGIYAIPDKAV